MVGALSVVMESHSCPCLCLDALPLSSNINMNLKSSGAGELVLQRNIINSMKRKHASSLELGSSFVDSWQDWRLCSKMIPFPAGVMNRKQRKDVRRLGIVNELGGQYEDTFGDVKTVHPSIHF